MREEATGNLCLGSKAAVQQRVGSFLAGLASRSGEVKRRCRTVLQSRAEALLPDSQPNSPPQANAHPTLALGLETTGSDQAFQDVRYWELNQSLEEILLRKIFLNIHLELLHGLSEILISHRRPMETVDDRVERAIKDAILQFGDRWYESESIREYPVGSYNHWLTRHRNFKDALLRVGAGCGQWKRSRARKVGDGFEIGDPSHCMCGRWQWTTGVGSPHPGGFAPPER